MNLTQAMAVFALVYTSSRGRLLWIVDESDMLPGLASKEHLQYHHC